MYKVYKYTFPNGKIYIGTTGKTVEERRDCGYQHNRELQSAMRQYGWKRIRVDILCEFDSKVAAFEAEKKAIADFKSTDPQIGYNKSYGGINTFEGLHHSDEHKEKMSRLYKGKKWSDESLKRMRASHKSERKPVVATNAMSGETMRFESLGTAAAFVFGHKSNISRSCGTGHIYKGFTWDFERG